MCGVVFIFLVPLDQLTLWATRKKQVIRLEAGAAGTSAAGLEMM